MRNCLEYIWNLFRIVLPLVAVYGVTFLLVA